MRFVSRHCGGLISLLIALSAAAPAQAITLGQVDNFQDGGVAAWGCCSTVTVTNIADAGPLGVGDHVLEADFTNRFVFFNRTQWTGDYTTAGVARISMDVQNANAFPLALRLGIASAPFGPSGSGNTYVTDYSIAVPNDNQWRRISFDIAPVNFIPSLGNGFPTPNAAAALASVYELRILHTTVIGEFRGDTVTGALRVNNILAEGPAVMEDADFDDDNDVDGQDFLVWQRGLGVGTTNATGDADASGSVNGQDLAIWKAKFGAPPTVAAAAAIPEPSGVVLACTALAGYGRALRRRR